VHAGYNNLEIQIDFPFEISPKDKSYPVIKTTDLAGDPLPAVVKTTVYELETSGKKYRKRLWNTPDQYVLSKAEFEKLFPYDEYEESENPERFRSEEHTSELQSRENLVCRLLLEKKKNKGKK